MNPIVAFIIAFLGLIVVASSVPVPTGQTNSQELNEANNSLETIHQTGTSFGSPVFGSPAFRPNLQTNMNMVDNGEMQQQRDKRWYGLYGLGLYGYGYPYYGYGYGYPYYG
jgi:hypothetical protein